MELFLPEQPNQLLFLIGLIASLIIGGYVLIRWNSKIASSVTVWLIAIVAVFGIHWYSLNEAGLYRMLAIICVLFTAMKIVVANTYFRNKAPFSFTKWLFFSLGWIGMNPSLFERPRSNRKQEAKQLLIFGISRVLLGSIICYIAYWCADVVVLSDLMWLKVLSSLLALVGISLILHFGFLNFNASFWNFMGVPAYPVFKSPLRSLSLTEFWGKRWNLAFSEMAAIAVYKPLKSTLGINLAKAMAFLFSGVLHELALSVPVGKGYGLPTLYFTLHAVLIQIENKLNFPSVFLKHLWVIFWLLVPMPLLFHHFFLGKVIWPFLGLLSTF